MEMNQLMDSLISRQAHLLQQGLLLFSKQEFIMKLESFLNSLKIFYIKLIYIGIKQFFQYKQMVRIINI